MRAALFVAVVVVLMTFSKSSSAYVGTGAPMCDELARSIEAPPVVHVFDGGTISEVLQCPSLSIKQSEDGAPYQFQIPLVLEAAKSSAIASGGFARSPLRCRLGIDALTVAIPVGFGTSVYRPPRS